ncbi:MAG: S8 family peptidase [Clostridia bacterium]|nr:S8 family peptidase [Clostridia bacterium]
MKLDRHLQEVVSLKGEEEKMIPVVIQCNNQRLLRQASHQVQKMGGKVNRLLPIISGFAAEIPAREIHNLAQLPIISFICHDGKAQAVLDIARPTVRTPSPVHTNLTGLGITIAVLDTGVYPHPDLTQPRSRLLAFKDFVAGRFKPYDDNGHGTHVCGILSGDGGLSKGRYRGIAPGARLVVGKVLDAGASGQFSDIIAGIQWVVRNRQRYGIKILSLSFGSEAFAPCLQDPLCRAVQKAWENGIIVVAAAGNSGPNPGSINSPGINPNIITVGSSDDRGTSSPAGDRIAPFSSRGPTIEGEVKPDLVAPGVSITSLNNNLSPSPYITFSGTSMSTPIVSGAIALLLQKRGRLQPLTIKQKLLEATNNLGFPANAQGKGLLDIRKLLE